MEFRDDRAIYLQIADYICESILKKVWSSGEKIPSVRDMSVQLEVNPNTVMRTFTYLQERDIIYNQRGIGNFVAAEAYDRTLDLKTGDFVMRRLPRLFREMDLLQISLKDMERYYADYRLAEDEAKGEK